MSGSQRKDKGERIKETKFVAFDLPEFLLVDIGENDGHRLFVDGAHEIVRLGRKNGEGISRFAAFEIAAPETGESVWLAVPAAGVVEAFADCFGYHVGLRSNEGLCFFTLLPTLPT